MRTQVPTENSFQHPIEQSKTAQGAAHYRILKGHAIPLSYIKMAACMHDPTAVVMCQQHWLGLEWEEFFFFNSKLILAAP